MENLKEKIDAYIGSAECDRHFSEWFDKGSQVQSRFISPQKVRFGSYETPVAVMSSISLEEKFLLVKVAYYVAAEGKNRLIGSAIIHDTSTGVSATFDLSRLSIWRTAKMAIFTLDKLSKHATISVGLIGCGTIGEEIVQQLRSRHNPPSHSLFLYDRNYKKLKKLHSMLADTKINCTICRDVQELFTRSATVISVANATALRGVEWVHSAHNIIILDYSLDFLKEVVLDFSIYTDDAQQLPKWLTMKNRVLPIDAEGPEPMALSCFIFTGQSSLDLHLILPILRQSLWEITCGTHE